MDVDTVLLCVVLLLVIYLIYTFDLLEGEVPCNPNTGQLCPDGSVCPPCGSNPCKCPSPGPPPSSCTQEKACEILNNYCPNHKNSVRTCTDCFSNTKITEQFTKIGCNDDIMSDICDPNYCSSRDRHREHIAV